MKKYIIILIASLMAARPQVAFTLERTTSMAQVDTEESVEESSTITPQLEREFYQKAYDLIKMYAESAKVSDDRDVTRFTDLFKDANTQICNDLMSLSYEPSLTVAEYVQLLHEADMVNVVIRNVHKGFISDEESYWQLPIYFEKSISFVNKCNTLFDSHDFYGYDFRLIATLALDKYSGRCYIKTLEAEGEIEPFPRDYRVLCKADERDANLDINGTYVKFIMDQKILRPGDKLSYRGAKVRESDLEGECDHKVFADYSDKAWRIRLGAGYAPSFNHLVNPEQITTTGNDEKSIGLDFGYVFPSTSHLRTGIFIGVGLSINNLTMQIPGGTFKTDKDKAQDIDEDFYTRVYEIGSLGITQKMSAAYDLTVPLYADFEYEFNSIFSAYADLGFKLQTSTGKMSIESIGNYTTYGEYDEKKYGGQLTIKDISELGFGENRNINNVDVNNNAAQNNKMTFNGLLGLGLRVNINKSFAIDAGGQYQIGGKSWVAEKNENIFSYSQIQDGANAKDKFNLLQKTEGINHNAFKVCLSLIYKF